MAATRTRKKNTGLSRDQKYALMYGDAGGFMAHLSPKARRQVKELARKRGLTVEGVIQPGPDALRSRSTEGLRNEAVKTVSAAYAPAERQLSDREQQIKNLDAKRQLDNKFYREWLESQQAKAEATSQASDQMLLSVVNNAHTQIDARYAQANEQLNQQNAGTTGAVSNPADFKGNERLTQGKEQATGAADIAQAAAVGQISRSGTDRAAIQAANFAQAAALEARRMGETWKSLADVASEKHSTQLQKAADTAKEVSRLLNNEVTKAQSNQQFAALAEKLGVQKQELNLKALTEKHNYLTKKSKLRADARTLDFKMDQAAKEQMLADKKYKLDAKKFGAAQAKERYLKEHKLGPYAPKKNSNAGSDANMQKNTRQGRAGILQANAISKDPKYKNNYAAYKKHLLAKDVNIAIINAGWQYSRGGIVPTTVKNLRGMGVVVPKEWRAGS